MKYETNPVAVVTKRLDVLQSRYEHLRRLQHNGMATIDQRIFDDLEVNYERGLDCLLQLKAKDEYRSYDAWYRRYLNVGDPL